MAANPKVISAMHSVPKKEITSALDSKPIDVKQRILDLLTKDLLIKIFRGHEDFLGHTPD
jgi:hypothetical protein